MYSFSTLGRELFSYTDQVQMGNTTGHYLPRNPPVTTNPTDLAGTPVEDPTQLEEDLTPSQLDCTQVEGESNRTLSSHGTVANSQDTATTSSNMKQDQEVVVLLSGKSGKKKGKGQATFD